MGAVEPDDLGAVELDGLDAAGLGDFGAVEPDGLAEADEAGLAAGLGGLVVSGIVSPFYPLGVSVSTRPIGRIRLIRPIILTG